MTLFSVKSTKALKNTIYEQRKKDWGTVVTDPSTWSEYTFSFFALDAFMNHVILMSKRQQRIYYHHLKGIPHEESAKWIGTSSDDIVETLRDIRDNSYGHIIGLTRETEIEIHCDGQFIAQMMSPSCPDRYRGYDLMVIKIMKEFITRLMNSYKDKICSKTMLTVLNCGLLIETVYLYNLMIQ